MKKTYKIKGLDDTTDICELCGKTNLKKVVILSILDVDENEVGEIRTGVNCAGSLVYGKKTAKNGKNVDTYVKAAELAKKWFSKGFTIQDVARGITARYGYQVDTRHGRFIIGRFAEIKV